MPRQIKQHPEKDNYFIVENRVIISDEYKKLCPEIDVLRSHTDRPVAVLGGGPSLPEDIKCLPEDCILISCNHYAFELVNPDYLCFLDDPMKENFPQILLDKIINPTCKRISFRMLEFTDYYVVNQIPSNLNYVSDTGRFATWAACYISTGDAYLCGIGLRDPNLPEHFGETGLCGNEIDMSLKIKQWEITINNCENPERIIYTSGPLKDHYENNNDSPKKVKNKLDCK